MKIWKWVVDRKEGLLLLYMLFACGWYASASTVTEAPKKIDTFKLQDGVYRYRDLEAGMVCYVVSNTGICCVPEGWTRLYWESTCPDLQEFKNTLNWYVDRAFDLLGEDQTAKTNAYLELKQDNRQKAISTLETYGYFQYIENDEEDDFMQ